MTIHKNNFSTAINAIQRDVQEISTPDARCFVQGLDAKWVVNGIYMSSAAILDESVASHGIDTDYRFFTEYNTIGINPRRIVRDADTVRYYLHILDKQPVNGSVVSKIDDDLAEKIFAAMKTIVEYAAIVINSNPVLMRPEYVRAIGTDLLDDLTAELRRAIGFCDLVSGVGNGFHPKDIHWFVVNYYGIGKPRTDAKKFAVEYAKFYYNAINYIRARSDLNVGCLIMCPSHVGMLANWATGGRGLPADLERACANYLEQEKR